LTDAEELCATARFCHRAGGTWKLVKNSDDLESKEIAITEACDCPSGRLVAWDKKSGKAIEPEFQPSIGLVEDPEKRVSGPIWVKGVVPIESSSAQKYEIRNRVTLCRCGASENKPFCDGRHIDIEFDDGHFGGE
jgi:CDGSH-type Zn-finger protein